MKHIGRRDLLRGTAALAAGAAVVPMNFPQAAGEVGGEDQTLWTLWRQFNAQITCCNEAMRVHTIAQEAVFADSSDLWRLKDLPNTKPFVATFVRFENGDPIPMQLPLKAEIWGEANMEAREYERSSFAEWKRTQKNARRKHRGAAAERAETAAFSRLREIEDAIGDTKAEGLDGILVKLAVAMTLLRAHLCEDENGILASCYQSVVALTGGRDIAAEATAIR